MDESIKDVQSDQRQSIPLDSSVGDKEEKVLPIVSNSAEALQALQLMIKDIANIQDPKEASEARKECYGFYKKILDQMEPAETLRIRENSKRIISTNERREQRLRLIFFFLVYATLLGTACTFFYSGRRADVIALNVGIFCLGLAMIIYGTLFVISLFRRENK